LFRSESTEGDLDTVVRKLGPVSIIIDQGMLRFLIAKSPELTTSISYFCHFRTTNTRSPASIDLKAVNEIYRENPKAVS
jgi:hypothetical protein